MTKDPYKSDLILMVGILIKLQNMRKNDHMYNELLRVLISQPKFKEYWSKL